MLLAPALLSAMLVQGGHAAPAPPSVLGCDPPDWWVGHSLDRIQLVVSGRDLAGCTLASSTPGVRVERQKVNQTGTCLIAWVHIARDARVGAADVRVDGPGGSTPVPFALLPKASVAPKGLAKDDVVYLVMPDRFADGDASNNGPQADRSDPKRYHGGDFKGLKSRLPYLKDLGVTAIWCTPIYDNDDARSDYHGYHATDFYSVEEHFGSMEDLRALVDEAHRLGLKVIQDQVANHTGATHPWLENPPTPTWFNGTRDKHLVNPFAIDAIVDKSADAEVRRATLEGWFVDRLPDLNQNDPETAAYLIQNSLWWVGHSGVDAIRQDTLPYVPTSFWAQWSQALHAEYPRLTLIGEVFNGNPNVVSYFQGGVAHDGVDSGVDTVFDFPMLFSLLGFISQRDAAAAVGQTLADDALYPNASLLVTIIGNHDTARAIGLLGGDLYALHLAETCQFTMRGIPQIYSGDEIAMPGADDPDNRRDFPGGFPGDPLDATVKADRSEAQQSTYEHTRRLLALRRAHPALTGPLTKVLLADHARLAYLRQSPSERAVVAVNAAHVPLPVAIDLGEAFPNGTRLVDALDPSRGATVVEGKISLSMPPQSAAIFFTAADSR